MTDLKTQLEEKKKELTLLEKRMHKYFLLNRTDAYTKILLKVVRLEGEIAILEQAIAEIDVLCNKLFEKDLLLQKQRQDFERLIDEVKNNEFNEDKTKELAKMVPEWSEGYYKGINSFIQTLKQQLNQPKTEDDN